MNKNELISSVATKTGFTKKDITSVVDAIFTTISDTMVSGGDVRITGFGTFTTTERAARDGVNPQTGAKIKIAATKAPKFKASTTLKTAIKDANI